jgi:hypothetical protein
LGIRWLKMGVDALFPLAVPDFLVSSREFLSHRLMTV